MLTQEQIAKITDETRRTDVNMAKFPHWTYGARGDTFPSPADIKAIAESIQVFNQYVSWEQAKSSPRQMIKFLVFKLIHPLLKPFFRKQLILNEYLWLLASTVARQNERIALLEQRSDESSNSN